jgi:DNA-binding LacI/PurR family transcriptional regulator
MNIKEVAKLAGVSKSTVSRVLNDSPLVTKSTRKKVLDVIKSVGFFPNYVARSLKIKETKTIGVIVPDIGNPFYFEVLRGIEKVLDKKGFNIMLCNSEYNEKKELRYISLLASKKVDGIIVAPSSEKSNGIKNLFTWNIPFVIFDIPQKKLKTNSILVDHSQCSYMATKYLIENGHKNIVVIDAFRPPGFKSKFILGYLKALNEYNIPINPEFIREALPDIVGGYSTIKKLITQKLYFTGVITICDLAAVGVYKAANKFNFKIPNDISVVGNDDIPLARYLNPPLTTIHQPKYLLGYKSAKLLLSQIQNKKHNDIKVMKLDVKLIKRCSVKRRLENAD